MATDNLKAFKPAPPPRKPRTESVVLSLRVRSETREYLDALIEELQMKQSDLIQALIKREYLKYYEA